MKQSQTIKWSLSRTIWAIAIAIIAGAAGMRAQGNTTCRDKYAAETASIQADFVKETAACRGPGDAPCFQTAVKKKATRLEAADQERYLCNKCDDEQKSGEEAAYDKAKVDADWSSRWAPQWNNSVFAIFDDPSLKAMRDWFSQRNLRAVWSFGVNVDPKGGVQAKFNAGKSRVPGGTEAGEKYREYEDLLKLKLEWSKAPTFPVGARLPNVTTEINSDNFSNQRTPFPPPKEPVVKQTVTPKLLTKCGHS